MSAKVCWRLVTELVFFSSVRPLRKQSVRDIDLTQGHTMLIVFISKSMNNFAQPEWKLKNQCHVNISSCMMRWCAGLHRTNAKKHNREIQDFFSAPINTNLAIFSSKVRSTVRTYIPHTLDAFAQWICIL